MVGGYVAFVDQDGGRAVASRVVGERGIVATPLGPTEALAALSDCLTKPFARPLHVRAVRVVDELDLGSRGCHRRLG